MVRWQVYVGAKKRGGDYNNEKRAIENGETIANTFKQVFVYRVVNGAGSQQVAKWVDGKRVL